MIQFDLNNNQYEDIRASLLRFCSDFAEAVKNSGDNRLLEGATGDMGTLYFDSSAEETELPPNDLIGIGNLNVQFDDQNFDISVSFGVSTANDPNLHRLDAIINRLFPLVYAERKIPLYDSRDGSPQGMLTATDGSTVFPVSGFNQRPVKFIQVAFVTDRCVVKPTP